MSITYENNEHAGIVNSFCQDFGVGFEKVAKIYSPDADGNCGYRAISMAIYGNQNSWKEVKEQILKTYKKYKDTLYANQVEDSDIFEKSLSCNLSPCPIQYLFNITDCPQIAADAFVRGIAVFSKASFNGKPFKTSSFFAPLAFEPTNYTVINILLDHNHFYLIETARTKTGRPVKFPIPILNPYHKAFVKRNPTLCARDYSIVF
ncbi:uncharacterized protein RHIMIDRAFT_295435 [Rhizopus microsporus ATCC 52813]|uniref:OTU domain-containing protein n=2 Tax=Rhizopus microsporus TaxID=58291 RepID=A0A2G4SH17_RHIZD|nr:uncharacterized protein RHIMIDRAFT_295435 [Rhizopus microsporus ATCC 52813]PHZ08064.1 hypothetical protein RHIMIDRAFT_295435 [Rhizopus microsporus ATCC 52813]